MPQSLGHSNIHIVFSTKNREPFINDQVEEVLHRYIVGICKDLRCYVHEINGMPDHLHMLVNQARSISLADLVSKVKANSSRWIKTQDPGLQTFAWQAGYGYFGIGASQLEAVQRYIRNQKQHHHPGRTFQDEMREAYRARNIEFDERYVWD